ncbi:hypothetical protein DQ04_01871080 [Trypanosoma grayi]|uniref:hypothetical protein n=1 Tax=Trypanosoma grayi TaxID=71804 RepID=UPI0004F499CB|nr:hypothetical protein DQ04_01871080 [Trypanosoma grayi]KEG12240.1 hypothetical protein DQ04_01871080 [Trypanosoma grayi]
MNNGAELGVTSSHAGTTQAVVPFDPRSSVPLDPSLRCRERISIKSSKSALLHLLPEFREVLREMGVSWDMMLLLFLFRAR